MPAQDYSTGDNETDLLRKLVRNTYFAAEGGGGGGGQSWVIKDANYALSSGDMIIADSGTGGVTFTFSGTPVYGSHFEVIPANDWTGAPLVVLGVTFAYPARLFFFYDGVDWKRFVFPALANDAPVASGTTTPVTNITQANGIITAIS